MPPSAGTVHLLLLILWGMALQYGVVSLEGDRLQRLQERLTDTGHAVFVDTAIIQPSIWRVITDYDLLLEDLPSVYFHATKPPGLQVFLMVIERLARPLAGIAVDRVALLASLLFPFLACVCLIPLLALLRRGRPKGDEDVSGVLYVFIPSIVLINLHADQYLYPLLGMSCLYFYVSALGQGYWLWALVAGAFFFVSLWFSFALLALLPAVPLLTYVAARSAGWRSSARTLGIASVGFNCTHLLFVWGLEYDALARWSQAIAAHAAAKGAQWGLVERAYYAALNLIEFSLWCGPHWRCCVSATYTAASVKWQMETRRWKMVSSGLWLRFCWRWPCSGARVVKPYVCGFFCLPSSPSAPRDLCDIWLPDLCSGLSVCNWR